MHPVPSGVEKRHRTMLILWSAFVLTVGFYFLVALFVESAVGGAGGDPVLVWALLGVALTMVAASVVLGKRFLARSVERQDPALVQTGLIVGLALCEAAALFGLVARLLTGTSYYYLFFVIAIIGMALHRPRRDDLLAASQKGGRIS